MTKKNNNNQVWLSPSKDGWRIHKPGGKRDIAHINTKQEGLERISQIARNQGLDSIVQRVDGTISSEGSTYPRSRDRCPPKG
jgi:hypothetical protein